MSVLPTRERLFLDSAVFMYAGGGAHPLREPSRAVLRGVADGTLEAVTSVEVVQEILHRFIAIRKPRFGIAMAADVISAFASLLPITHAVALRMPHLVERDPDLAARDLIHVATCLEEGIDTVISSDRGFYAVTEIRRLDLSTIAEAT